MPVRNPASSGITLTGKKVAFADAVGGDCATELADKLSQGFQAQGAVLIERSNLDSILREHNFQASGSVDVSTAVQIGKILGSSMMAFVRTSRCEARQEPLRTTDFLNHVIFISQTQAFLDGSVRLVDLTTGQDLGVTPINLSPKKQNTSQQGQPEYAPGPEVIDDAIQHAAEIVEQAYFPWTAMTSVDFLDKDDCGLKLAYNLLKAGDTAGALKQSQDNVAACQSDSNTGHRANALYNLGLAQMLSGQFDAALNSLNQAERLHDDKRFLAGISQVQTAQQRAQALAASNAAQAAAAARAAQSDAQRQQATAAATLTNDTVIKLAKGGLSDEVIIKMIADSPGNFVTTADSLLSLKQAGVSDKVISAMMDKH